MRGVVGWAFGRLYDRDDASIHLVTCASPGLIRMERYSRMGWGRKGETGRG